MPVNEAGWQKLLSMATGDSLQWRYERGTAQQPFLLIAHIVKSAQLNLRLPSMQSCLQTEVEGVAGTSCLVREFDWQGTPPADGKLRVKLHSRGDLAQVRYRINGQWLRLLESVSVNELFTGKGLELFMPSPVDEPQDNPVVLSRAAEKLRLEFFVPERMQRGDSFSIPIDVRSDFPRLITPQKPLLSLESPLEVESVSVESADVRPGETVQFKLNLNRAARDGEKLSVKLESTDPAVKLEKMLQLAEVRWQEQQITLAENQWNELSVQQKGAFTLSIPVLSSAPPSTFRLSLRSVEEPRQVLTEEIIQTVETQSRQTNTSQRLGAERELVVRSIEARIMPEIRPAANPDDLMTSFDIDINATEVLLKVKLKAEYQWGAIPGSREQYSLIHFGSSLNSCLGSYVDFKKAKLSIENSAGGTYLPSDRIMVDRGTGVVRNMGAGLIKVRNYTLNLPRITGGTLPYDSCVLTAYFVYTTKPGGDSLAT
ncbi:MAG: hypothetical protein ACRC5A_12510, partial [Enterobacteriaceae bacterium]